MPLSDPALWRRIEGAALVPPPSGPWTGALADGEFRALLVREMDVSAEDAARLVAEYRRFLYLKALDGGLLSPPPDLDEVWHRHLDWPEGAWDRFCQTAVGRPLLHTRGLDKSRARAAHFDLLALYHREFGPPPADIWPGPAELRRDRLASLVFVGGLAAIFAGVPAALALLDAALARPVMGGLFLAGVFLIVLSQQIGRGTRVERHAGCG